MLKSLRMTKPKSALSTIIIIIIIIIIIFIIVVIIIIIIIIIVVVVVIIIIIIIIIIITIGRMGNGCQRFLKHLADKIAQKDTEPYISYCNHLAHSPVILWFEVKVIATEFLSLPNDR